MTQAYSEKENGVLESNLRPSDYKSGCYEGGEDLRYSFPFSEYAYVSHWITHHSHISLYQVQMYGREFLVIRFFVFVLTS